MIVRRIVQIFLHFLHKYFHDSPENETVFRIIDTKFKRKPKDTIIKQILFSTTKIEDHDVN